MLPVIILFITLIIIIYFVQSKNNKPETFIPSLTYVVDDKPEYVNVYYPPYIDTSYFNQFNSIKGVFFKKDNSAPYTVHQNTVPLFIQDTYVYRQNQSNTHILSILPLSRVLYILTPTDIKVKNILTSDVTIGCFSNIEKQLLEMFYRVLDTNIKIPNYNIRLITSSVIDTHLFEQHKIDCLAIFNVLEFANPSALSISRNFKFDIVDYGEYIDSHKLMVTVPFAITKNIDFSLYFSQLRGKRNTIKTVLCFEHAIFGDKDIHNINVNTEFQNILERTQPELINYYSQYFSIYDISQNYIRNFNSFVKVRDNLQILEQFSDKMQDSDATAIIKNVDGFFDSHNKELIISSDLIDGVPIKVGDVLTLANQMRVEENGKYKCIFTSRYQSILKQQGQERQQQEGSITSKRFAPGFVCYDQPEIQSKSFCESQFSVEGSLKKTRSKWDKPCKTNDECPFYQANKNYKNYRGGCLDGYCEMPVGIKRISFRYFDETSKPVCYNCLDTLDIHCCDKQKNKKLYPKLLSPDYAFDIDQFERMN